MANPSWLAVDAFVPTSPKLVIKTSNAADKGTYKVVMSSSLNTHPNRTNAGSKITLEVFLKVDACYKTKFSSDPTAAAMAFEIKDLAPPTKQVLTPITDTVTAGGGNCGPLLYTLSSDRKTSKVMTTIDASTHTVSVQTTDPKDLGDHNVKMVITLANYPEISPFIKKEVSFVVTITGVC
jgi:hypothetical protein